MCPGALGVRGIRGSVVRSPAVLRGLLLLVLLLLTPGLCAGCQAFPGHPLRPSQPRLATTPHSTAGAIPEPPPPGDEEIEALLFLGLEGLLKPLHELHERPLPPNQMLVFGSLPKMEAAVRRRLGKRGLGGPLRHIVAVGATGHVPLAPMEMADLIMDPAVEEEALVATVCRLIRTEYAMPGARREHFRLELLKTGMGPFRYDLRFTVIFERRELSDGRVFLRYDLGATPPNEHVTLYRGGCLIEPSGSGSRVTEIIIFGLDILMPPFIQNALRNLVAKTLRTRATTIWEHASAR